MIISGSVSDASMYLLDGLRQRYFLVKTVVTMVGDRKPIGFQNRLFKHPSCRPWPQGPLAAKLRADLGAAEKSWGTRLVEQGAPQ